MIELILFALLGVAVGILTGLVPGLHVNTIIPMILSSAILFGNPYFLAILIISIAITQVFIGFIPSIFLGAPDEGTAFSVLPGHKLLFQGRGFEAIKLTAISGMLSLFITLLLVFALSDYFKVIYEISRQYMHYILLAVIAYMILSEKKLKKILFATLIIILSGFFGIITLNASLIPQNNVLFPIFSGMFGMSILIVSISEKSKIPLQTFDNKINLSMRSMLKSTFLGSIAGIVVGFLPAVGVSQAAAVVQTIGRTVDPRSFLVSLSGINTANEIFSMVSLYLVGNPRSGASVAIGKLLPTLTSYDVLLMIGVIAFVSGIAASLTISLGKRIPKMLERIDYKKLSTGIIIFIASMVVLLTGIYGLLILFTAVSIGLLCNHLGVRRGNCMGVLLIPSVLFFAGLTPITISVLGL